MDIIGILKAIVVGLFKAYFWLPNLVMDFCFAHLGSIGVLIGIFAFMLILSLQAYLLGIVWVLLGGEVPASVPEGVSANDFDIKDDKLIHSSEVPAFVPDNADNKLIHSSEIPAFVPDDVSTSDDLIHSPKYASFEFNIHHFPED